MYPNFATFRISIFSKTKYSYLIAVNNGVSYSKSRTCKYVLFWIKWVKSKPLKIVETLIQNRACINGYDQKCKHSLFIALTYEQIDKNTFA